MAINDGGAAFPEAVSADAMGGLNYSRHPGLSIRDYFAAKAMQGWLSSFDGDTPHPACVIQGDEETRDARLASFGRNAYALADAMLAARENG